MGWQDFWSSFLNLIYPQQKVCPLCGKPWQVSLLCPSCSRWLEARQREASCYCCGRPTLGPSLCGDCMERQWPFELARSVGPYSDLLKKAVYNLKYRRRRSLAAPLGQLMLQVALAEKTLRQVDWVLPVPMNPAKLRRRGFNQAELLAQEVATGLNLPIYQPLQKKADTLAQAGLNRQQREKNLEGAFTLRNNGIIWKKKVLIIDDVFTTGATVSAVGTILRQAGASQVLVLTLASTAKREDIFDKKR